MKNQPVRCTCDSRLLELVGDRGQRLGAVDQDLDRVPGARRRLARRPASSRNVERPLPPMRRRRRRWWLQICCRELPAEPRVDRQRRSLRFPDTAGGMLLTSRSCSSIRTRSAAFVLAVRSASGGDERARRPAQPVDEPAAEREQHETEREESEEEPLVHAHKTRERARDLPCGSALDSCCATFQMWPSGSANAAVRTPHGRSSGPFPQRDASLRQVGRMSTVARAKEQWR